MDTWEDKSTGEKRSKIRVQADRVQFLDSRRGDSQGEMGGLVRRRRLGRQREMRAPGAARPRRSRLECAARASAGAESSGYPAAGAAARPLAAAAHDEKPKTFRSDGLEISEHSPCTRSAECERCAQMHTLVKVARSGYKHMVRLATAQAGFQPDL